MKLRSLFAAAIAAIGLSATSAFAVTCGTSAGLDTTNVSITSIGGSSVSSIDATDCAGMFSGNDTGAQGTLLTNLNSGMFSGDLASGWSLFGKSDDGSGKVYADLGKTNMPWSVNFTPDAFSVFTVTLKGSTGYATYLFDLRPNASNMFGGQYSMTGILNNGGQIPDLSHLTIATWGDPDAYIPLPAAGWLLIGGIGGLAALRRKKKAA